MITTALEMPTSYRFTVVDDGQSFVFDWCKEPPAGQTLEDYLQQCKTEAELLAAHEIAMQAEPTPLDL